MGANERRGDKYGIADALEWHDTKTLKITVLQPFM